MFERNILNLTGYSVTSGCYYNQGERLYASGAPRSSTALGKVFIFSFSRRNRDKIVHKDTIESEQYGEYFGSSLASCDLNNDGRDDLIIGAPQWSKDGDEGRIYVRLSKIQVISIFALSPSYTYTTAESEYLALF